MRQSGPIHQDMHDVADEQMNNVTQLQLCCPGPLQCCLASTIGCPAWLSACSVLDVKQEKVLLSFGKYLGTLRDPGCYCINPHGLAATVMSTAAVSLPLHNVKVADLRGNPLLLSGVVTYRVTDARKAALDVSDYREFVSTQGTTVMKRVASQYPYESRKPGEQDLKHDAGHLRDALVSTLQERLNIAGVLVLNFELNDLAYAPEIAQQMLVRQQAEAIVDARKLIAEGATEIVAETLKSLATKGVEMDPHERARMASNLVVIICGEQGAQAMVNVGRD